MTERKKEDIKYEERTHGNMVEHIHADYPYWHLKARIHEKQEEK